MQNRLTLVQADLERDTVARVRDRAGDAPHINPGPPSVCRSLAVEGWGSRFRSASRNDFVEDRRIVIAAAGLVDAA